MREAERNERGGHFGTISYLGERRVLDDLVVGD